MKSILSLLVVLQSMIVTTYSFADPVKINISIETDVYQTALKILGNETAFTVGSFAHPECQRDVVEFIIVQRAIKLGGFDVDFEFDVGNVDARNLKMLARGMLLLSFDTIWMTQAEAIAENVYISDAMIRKGEFVAGVYSSVENAKRIKLERRGDFQRLSVVSSRDWFVDWQTLSELKPRELIHEEDWVSMAKLVSLGWVDVMIVSFGNQYPFVIQEPQFKIVAIEGVKVALKDSRHFIVSRHHPYGEQTFTALQKGLKQLRDSGFIERAYRECGFLNERTKDWRVLNP